jgi:glutamate transport system substrate-binding protein
MVGTALLILAACAGPSSEPPATSAPVSFAEGSTMAQLAGSGTVRIGVKTDVPGLGYLPPDAPEGATPEGFDIEIAKLIAARLQIDPQDITWVALDTYEREGALTDAEVDLVVATYSMTKDRQQVVGQAGPYYVTGQQIMVREDSDITGLEDLDGKSVCSVAGSESDEPVVAEGAVTKAFSSYAACVDALLAGDLDAVSTDGAILAGFLDQHPEELIIVGTPFTTQRYGIGYRHGDTAMCQFLRASLLKAYEDGSWKAAFESTIGKSGIEAPRAPRPDACPAG